MTEPDVERYALSDDGLVPNNATLPLMVYRAVLPAIGPDAERRIITQFAANGWSNAWINGIYDFHHYHATAHEVLGLARGWADVQFGGPGGPVVRVQAGDAVLVPAGVGHCRRAASPDLSVVGAYPGGADWDLVRATPEARVRSIALIAKVARPVSDPVVGGAIAD